MLFPETLKYQRDLAAHLGLSDIRVIAPERSDLMRSDVDGLLHSYAPDACCALRKRAPLERALEGFGGWITGRKRAHGGKRVNLALFEKDQGARIKINPLASWSAAQTQAYFKQHDLPRHPLVGKGFASIGCAPCTTRVEKDEDPRAGRWRGSEKTECGIHFESGAAARARG